jgi:ABC-type enterochelin transport system substrate-binding protein
MRHPITSFVLLTVVTVLAVALSGCSHEAAFKKQRAQCQAMSAEAERSRCIQKLEADERDYQRKQNETNIERNYKRKLQDMKPG